MTCSGKYICITFVISLVWFVIGGILATILMHLFYCNCDRAHQLASSEPTYNYDKDQQGKEMWSTAPGYLSTTDKWEEDVEMTTQESISMSNPTTRSGKNDISTRSTRQAACPLGSINLGNSCYRFDTKQTRTKYEAAEYCASYQSSLVSIESQSEQDFLVNHIKESKVIPANIQDKDWDIINAYSYWTGLTDWAVTDVYRWDASGEVANFTAWSWFQPNSVDGHCVLLYAQHPDLLWNDISCDKKASTICEADIIMC